MTVDDTLNCDDPVIDIRAVSKRFGRKSVLHDLNLTVPRGQTFAFLGRNGAGKTTTIRMLLGLHAPDAGTVRVLGLDPAKDATEIRRRVGYLAEDQQMFGWMTVAQTLSFTAPFYPSWNHDWADHLARKFDLPMKTKVKHLSKGQSVRLGLLLAVAHHPRLIILDDPTLGLDPIVRKEFLRDLVSHFQGSAVTIFFSSHLLYEVEPVADAVAILDRGAILRCAPTERLRDTVKQIILPAYEYDALGPLPGTLDIKRRGNQVAVVVEDIDRAQQELTRTAATCDLINLNLDEIFEAYVIGKRQEDNHVAQPGLERVA